MTRRNLRARMLQRDVMRAPPAICAGGARRPQRCDIVFLLYFLHSVTVSQRSTRKNGVERRTLNYL